MKPGAQSRQALRLEALAKCPNGQSKQTDWSGKGLLFPTAHAGHESATSPRAGLALPGEQPGHSAKPLAFP